MFSASRIGAANRNGHAPVAATGTDRLEHPTSLAAAQGLVRWLALSRRWRWGMAGAVAVFLWVGWLLAQGPFNRQSSTPPRTKATAARGRVEGADREVPLRPQTSGSLAVLHVKVGQVVPEDRLLFELNNAVEKQRVAVAQAQVKSAETRFELARCKLGRSQGLGTRIVTQEGYEVDKAHMLESQAQLEEARAQLELAKAELAKTQVRAPVTGEVLQIYPRLGEMVGRESKRPVMLLADTSRRRVRASVDELHVARVHLGQRAIVTADGFAGMEFVGKVVEKMGVMGESAPRSDEPGEFVDMYYLEVLIELAGGQELPIGYRVDVRIAE
jgi:multidrug resistance efflux pump